MAAGHEGQAGCGLVLLLENFGTRLKRSHLALHGAICTTAGHFEVCSMAALAVYSRSSKQWYDSPQGRRAGRAGEAAGAGLSRPSCSPQPGCQPPMAVAVAVTVPAPHGACPAPADDPAGAAGWAVLAAAEAAAGQASSQESPRYQNLRRPLPEPDAGPESRC